MGMFMPLPVASFEACNQTSGRVSSQTLVRYDTNDGSVPVACGHQEVWVRDYIDRVVIGCRGEVIAGSCKNFDELRQAHNDACKVKQQVPYTIPKTGKKSVRTKALRVDKHTLYSSVISLPILSADAWAMLDLMNECMELFHQVVRFEKDRLEAAGGQFAMAVVNRDEAHMHIHVYGVDPVRGEITWLHPGKAAVDNIRRGAGWKKDNVAEQDRAYCDAMRQWQDDFYTSVFRDAGLMRYGP